MGIWIRGTIDVEGLQYVILFACCSVISKMFARVTDAVNGLTFATNNGMLSYPTTVRSSTFLMFSDNLGEARSWQIADENGRHVPNQNQNGTALKGK